MKPTVRVSGEDDASGCHLLKEERDDGSLALSRDASYEAILERAPGRPLSEREFDELIAPYMLPPDGEG